MQITGSGFTNAGGEQVNFGANPATSFTVNSNTSITAIAPASTTGDGPVDVTVTNGGQTSPISQPADQFTYIPPTRSRLPTERGADVGQRPGRGLLDPRLQRGLADPVVPGDGDRRLLALERPQQRRLRPRDLHRTPWWVPTVRRDSCTVPGLTNGDQYTFSVTATNGLGTSVPSPATTAITVGDPGPPTGVSATAAQNANSTISWTDPANTGAGPLLSETATAKLTSPTPPAPPTGCSAPTTSPPARATTRGAGRSVQHRRTDQR